MTLPEQSRSRASGWSVGPTVPPFSWQWSAWGPRGGEYGTAQTKRQAEQRAQAAERRLLEPTRS